MGLQIAGADGSIANVRQGQLATDGLTAFARAARRGDAWACSNATADIDAGDTVLAVKNNSGRIFYVEKIVTGFLSATVTEGEIVIHRPAAYTPAGTAVTPVNMLSGAADNGDLVAKGDETGATQGDFLDHAFVREHVLYLSEPKGAVVLLPGQGIAVDLVAETTQAYCTIWGWFEDD